MADFVAVLKKTLDGLSDTTPQMREKVYERARITIASKLATMNPPLPDSVIEKQKQALDEAIVQVEAEYARKPVDPLSELESVFASLRNPDPRAVLKEPVAKAAPVERPAAPVEKPAPAAEKPAVEAPAHKAAPAVPLPVVERVAPVAPTPRSETVAPVAKASPVERTASARPVPPVVEAAPAPAAPEPASLPRSEWLRPDDEPDDRPLGGNGAPFS